MFQRPRHVMDNKFVEAKSWNDKPGHEEKEVTLFKIVTGHSHSLVRAKETIIGKVFY